MLQMNNEVRQRTHTVAMLGRLAEQFRRDVHQAHGEPLVAADHRAVELRLPGGKIVKWRIDEQDGVVRTEQAPDRRRPRGLVPPAQRHRRRRSNCSRRARPGSSRMRVDSPGTRRAFAGDRGPGIPR